MCACNNKLHLSSFSLSSSLFPSPSLPHSLSPFPPLPPFPPILPLFLPSFPPSSITPLSLLLSLPLSLPASLPPGVIDVAAVWMSDLKSGLCVYAGHYNKKSCCWINNETNLNYENEHCNLWSEWSLIARITGAPFSTAGYAFDYFIFVVLVVTFAGFAGFFVIALAPYASGSGIPEVCVCVYGFLLRRVAGNMSIDKITNFSLMLFGGVCV